MPEIGTDGEMNTPILDSPRLSRRRLLGGLGGAAALAAGGLALPRTAAAAPVEAEVSVESTPGGLRRQAAWKLRKDAADFHRGQAVGVHPTNGDETRYPNRIGNYSKSLPHNSFGEVDPTAYDSFLQAVNSGDPDDFDAIVLDGPNKLTSPQGGLAFD